MPRQRVVLAALLAGLLLPGCGGSLVKPGGRVVKGQTSFLAEEGEVLHITFVPAEGNDKEFTSYPAEYHREDGTFRVLGKDGHGVPPGKYSVTVELMKNRKDVFKERLTARSSPFQFEVTGSASDLVIDLDKVAQVSSTPRPKTRRKG
jgi:hypothetical protein